MENQRSRTKRRRQRRGAVKVRRAEHLGVWVDRTLARRLDAAVVVLDSDRSKIMRAALREYIEARLEPRPA